jgi:very-short-patch-repair endonuclease
MHSRDWIKSFGCSGLTGSVGETKRWPHRLLISTPRIPHELTERPFSLDEAREAGLTWSALRGKAWRRVGPRLYRLDSLPDDPLLTLFGWQRVLPPETVFIGATAAWLHRLGLEPTKPVEIALPVSSGVRSRDGLMVRRLEIPRHELVSIRGIHVTALLRTLADLSLRLPPVEALVAVDAAVRKRLTSSIAMARYAISIKGRPGAARLRSLAQLAAPAESPMETRLRWLLIEAGLQRPQVQAKLLDGAARADLYYPEARLVIEYDGGNHRDRLAEDDQRQNLLVRAGYRLLRFTASDVYGHQDVVIDQVRGALAVTPSKRFRNPSMSL